MGDHLLGADPARLDDLAVAFARGARVLEDGSRRLRGELGRLQWSGAAADEVRARWLPTNQHAATLAAAELRRAAARLAERSTRQRFASRPTATPLAALRPLPPVVAVAGDLAAARHVAVLVPGMGTTVDDLDRLRRDAAALRSAAGEGETAVVAWVGYRTPSGWEVASDRLARVGAGALVRFVDDLRARTAGDVTVVGHSYGSVTAAWAARAGLAADRLVVIGSPGLGVDHADALALPPGVPLYAGAIEGDPVAVLRWFGNDPTSWGFGSRSFDAGIGLDHSGYFAPGSVALANLARIVRGQKPTPRPATPLERAADRLRARGASVARPAVLAADLLDDLLHLLRHTVGPRGRR